MQVTMRPKPCCGAMRKAFGDIIHFNADFGIYFSTSGDPEEYNYARLQYCPWCGEKIDYVEDE